MLKGATQTALLEILEEGGVGFEYRKAEHLLTIKENRSRILFRSMDEFERLRGTNLSWFGLDELTYTAEEAWLRLEGRLRDPKATRLGGFVAWTPKGYDWVHRKFLQNQSGYEVVVAEPYENRYILDTVPDFYERLRHSYDKDFFEQEVLGRYLNVEGGQVYRAFSRVKHVRALSINVNLPLLWALDFNVDPMCSVVAQQEGLETHVLDEIVLSKASTQNACDEFSRRYASHRQEVVVYGDASGNNRSTKGSSDYEIVKEHFRRQGNGVCRYEIPRSNPAVRDRVGSLNATLENALGEITLLIDPKCKGLILDLEQVTYREGTAEIDKMKDKDRTHLSDALGYLIWARSRPIRNAGPQERRIL
jgi:hypothetical protein